jgi:hypothetical protein
MNTTFRSVWSERRADGARAELATMTHDGREYSALGAVIDHKRGRVVGYVKGATLTAWDGALLGTLRAMGRVRLAQWSPSGGEYLTCYRATIDGRAYYGRGLGEGMVLRLRAYKSTGRMAKKGRTLCR